MQVTREEVDGIFLWLLGENGNFPDRPEGAGLYWWRKDLRHKYEALLATSSATTPCQIESAVASHEYTDNGLLHCPFCRSEKVDFTVEHDSDGFGLFLAVKCSGCRATSGQQFSSDPCPQTHQEVRETWNRRAGMSPPKTGVVPHEENKVVGASHECGSVPDEQRDRHADYYNFEPTSVLACGSALFDLVSEIVTDADAPTVEELIACLGDDAAKLRNSNPGDEMADTMTMAASCLENMHDMLEDVRRAVKSGMQLPATAEQEAIAKPNSVHLAIQLDSPESRVEPERCDYGNEDDFDEAHDEWERAQRYAAVGAMEYNGNTVSYMYSKAKNYGNVLLECCRLIGGSGHLRDRIKGLIAERDALKSGISSPSFRPNEKDVVGQEGKQ